MRKLTSVLATCAALAVSVSSAHAAQLYVPLTNYPGDGTTLEIVVTNPGPPLRRPSPEPSSPRAPTATPTTGRRPAP